MQIEWGTRMKLITNTDEIKYGDIVLGLPGKYKNDTFFRSGKHCAIYLNKTDSCWDICIPPEDVESFSEECKIVKCIMINKRLHFVDLKTGNTFCWDKDVDTIYSEYTIWKLDIKF